MKKIYPTYKYTSADAQNQIAKLVRLNRPDSYPFDNFHAHEYNEILVFLTGGGNHNISFKNYKIKDNSIHLLAANDLHWLERSMKSTGFAIVYKDQFLHKLQIVNPNFDYCSLFSNSRVINLNQESSDDFAFIFRELLNNKNESAYMLQVIGAFIAKIANLNYIEPPNKKIYDPIVPEVIKLVEQYYKTKMTLTGYASILNLSAKTLRNRFEKASTISIKELITQRKIKEAKKMLCSNNMNISEISFELGFKEIAHFSNWFYKNVNCYPLDYKYEND